MQRKTDSDVSAYDSDKCNFNGDWVGRGGNPPWRTFLCGSWIKEQAFSRNHLLGLVKVSLKKKRKDEMYF